MLLRVKFISYRKPPTGPGARKSCDMLQVALVGGLNGSICVLKIRLIIRSCSMTLYLAENPLQDFILGDSARKLQFVDFYLFKLILLAQCDEICAKCDGHRSSAVDIDIVLL
jgi:hypothetical protein